ncbi:MULTISPECIES: O-methyltransferase [unclassified Bacillus (in: firmicutes)]|uniref:O-methyltransferase n=1 Tax=unclassified Bacillus (in: firmicutes) TaxID=185979 RepID=UPI001BEC9C31|nr:MULTISPECIES: O-methyltransferase [unclassified Bacillus (in: firmicutes)]MBT2636419.1 O-methyltransferase [Bacillus sp. ISL-39]MBT2660702.1 O-methyltransferase [Bacillus sp. ISL-45]
MLSQELQSYIDTLIQPRNGLLLEMEEYADQNGVPIMEPAGIETMLQLLRIQQPKAILEVGTAIGYSALRMSFALPQTKIVTLERDEERFKLAVDYIKRADRQQQIIQISGDALELVEEVAGYAPFDAIFIDAAKGQYKRFFEMYSGYLKPGGMIITDNVLFKGLVYNQEADSRRLRSLVKKIDEFNRWLAANQEYDTVILPIGDGIAISKKR